jgi:hypothetical protein
VGDQPVHRRRVPDVPEVGMQGELTAAGQ